MQFPITIGLHRSFLQPGLLVVLALAAALTILLSPWTVPVQVLLLLCLLPLTYRSFRSLDNPVRGLMLSKEGELHVRFRGKDESYFPVLIMPGATLFPSLIVVRMQYEGHLLVLLITPDCIAVDDFRRLRVWLKWQAIFGEHDAGG